MLNKLSSLYAWSRPWRLEYGQWGGLQLALSLRKAAWAGTPGSLVSIRVPGLPHPVQLRAGTSDSDVFLQIFQEQQGDFPVVASPRVIVDAGANIGLTSIVLANRYPRARILALEIDRDNFSLLSRNVAPYPNITALLKGLWSHQTRVAIENPEAGSWGFRAREIDDRHTEAIEALGVDDLLSAYSLDYIDLLKIDIEGGEYDVFSRGVESWADRVGVIAVEMHERFRPGCREIVRRALAAQGFVESQWSEYSIFARK